MNLAKVDSASGWRRKVNLRKVASYLFLTP